MERRPAGSSPAGSFPVTDARVRRATPPAARPLEGDPLRGYASRADLVVERDDLKSWLAYLAVTRRGYLGAFEKLSPGELSRDRGASHPSIADIFAHPQGALYFWIRNGAPDDLPPPEPDLGDRASLAELKGFETYLQTHVERFVTGLTETGLERTVTMTKGRASDHDCHLPVREILWHLVEEELQHLGELNALLWQIDVEAPVYSWTRWAHEVGRVRDRAAP